MVKVCFAIRDQEEILRHIHQVFHLVETGIFLNVELSIIGTCYQLMLKRPVIR